MRQVMTISPFAGLGGILGVTGLLWGLGSAAFLASMVVGSFVGGGKFVIFGTEMTNLLTQSLMGATYESVDFSPWALAALVVYGDLATCSVMMANMTLLYRTPWLGRRLASAHEAGWYVLHVHRWMHRVAWLGVAVFVAAPFQGSGAVIGTIIARILGLSRPETFTAMLVGSGVGCSVLALLGDVGRQQAQMLASHPVISLVILAGIVVLLMLLGRWFMGHASEAREQFRAAHPPHNEPSTENEQETNAS